MAQKRNPRSSVEDRWHRADGSPSKAYAKGKRWRARYVDEQGQDHARSFERKTDASRWLNEVIAAQVTGNYVDPRRGAITLKTFYQDWSQRQVWVRGTLANVDLAVRSVTFGDVPFNDLRPSHVEAWVKDMLERGLQPSTIKTRFNSVRAVLRAAERDRLLPRDPAANVRLPRSARPEAAMQIPTPAEVGQLMDGCTEHLEVMRAFVVVCAFAGLRLGEACGLKVSDIDFLRGEIQVARQSQKGEIRAPKYGSSRTLYVPQEVVTELAEHVRKFCPGDDPDRWLWSNAKGAWTADIVQPRFVRLREKVGLGYTIHHLRHYYASGLIAAGCDVVTVQRAMGHQDATTTLRVYSHLWPRAEDRTRRASAAMFAESTADALRTGTARESSDLR
ncbi:tyrosine-type recombinase/integrase [Gordonia paraffinivorans]|uniref:tyrosine-type recombinase/integrase n=1 Tax=Gordonia paraffinivorans TaxID=175628 RepID=UPI001444CF9C|nr:site-specific integrase [Gordonia paraffinivorans]